MLLLPTPPEVCLGLPQRCVCSAGTDTEVPTNCYHSKCGPAYLPGETLADVSNAVMYHIQIYILYWGLLSLMIL